MTLAPLCFLDTETTGVHPGRQVWEVGFIRREPDGGEIAGQFFVEVDLAQADPFGLNVGRFYQRHPLGRDLAMSGEVPAEQETKASVPVYSRGKAARIVARATHGAHLVGAVPSFDANTLDPLLRAHGYVPAWHYHLVDVEALAIGYLVGRVSAGLQLRDGLTQLAPPWQSRDLGRALGVPDQPEDAKHTALGDARWAKAIYDHVMEGRP